MRYGGDYVGNGNGSGAARTARSLRAVPRIIDRRLRSAPTSLSGTAGVRIWLVDELVWLRLAHILPGVFWVGAAIFLAAFLEPALHRLGTSVEGPVMAAVGRTAGPALTLAGLLTIVFGIVLTARTPGRDMEDLFVNPWGWAIGLGAVASVVAMGLGLFQSFNAQQIARIVNGATAPPGPVEQARLGVLGRRIRVVGQLDAVLVTAAVGLMASARFIH